MRHHVIESGGKDRPIPTLREAQIEPVAPSTGVEWYWFSGASA